MSYHRVYSHVLESSVPIPEWLSTYPRVVPNLRIDFSALPGGSTRRGYTLRLVSQDRLVCGEPLARLYENRVLYLLSYTGIADFELSKSGRQVGVHLWEDAAPDKVWLFLVGPVLSFALELQGIPSLHASAVSVADKGVAFVAVVRGGKSTLAASFMQAGCRLLSDDILPLTRKHGLAWASPGYPQMRMWPDEAQHFLGHYEDLERVLPALSKRRVPVGPDGFGAFCDEPQPLACVYLPERRDAAEWGTKVEIAPVSRREAVIELVRHSFCASLVEPLGLQPQRLDFFARMVQQVPLRRLIYPTGFEHLPRVREAVLADVGESHGLAENHGFD